MWNGIKNTVYIILKIYWIMKLTKNPVQIKENYMELSKLQHITQNRA